LFANDKMLYLVLRGRWYGIIVMNAREPVEVQVMTQRTVL